MNTATFIKLINNTALLLALGVLYDTIALKQQSKKTPVQALTGLVLGAIGIAVMMTSWEFAPGVIFDTRSILLSVGGLFFGFIPTLVAVVVTGVYRLYLGGAEAWTGVAVIVTSGAIGVGWRHLRRNRLQTISLLELYILGIVVHIAMLSWMLSLSGPVATEVLSKASLPVMIVYPVGTVLLGKLVAARRQRKQAADALQENVERLLRTQRVAQMGFLDWNLQTNKILVSDQVYRIYGIDPTQTPAITPEIVEQAVHPDDLEYVQKNLGLALQGIQEYDIDHRIVRLDGEVLWVHAQAEVVRDDDDNPKSLLGTIIDITQHKRAEEALRESEDRYRMLAENVTDAVWAMDMNLKFTYVSPSNLQLRGYTADEVMDQSIDRVMLPESLGEAMALLAQKLEMIQAGDKEGWDPIVFDAKQPCKDGTIIWTRNNAKIILDSENRPTGIIGVTHNITERKRAEKELRQSEELQRTLLETSPDYIFVLDANSTILRANRIRHGHDGEDIIGQSASEFVMPKYRDAFDQAVRKAADTRQLQTVETILDLPGGQRYILNRLNPVDLAGEQGSVVLIATDITEQVRMEQQLRKQEQLATVGQLSAGIAHDFRNLLTAIILYAQMSLRQPDLSFKLTQNLETIIGESKKAADLVQQILDFSSRSMLRVQTLSLQALTRSMISILQSTIPGNVRISLQVESGQPSDAFTVQADSGRIQQMLANLASNAHDAMPYGGELRMELSRLEVRVGETPPVADMEPGAWVCLTVADTGVGMTEQVHAHLFEPFFTTKEVGKGTGLGLAQVYGIVRQHEGYIDVETELGQGTTFRIYLPAHKEDNNSASAKKTEAEKPPAPSRGQGETILLVEDDESLREAELRILKLLGYRVLVTTNGVEALAAYKASGQVDLVITDIMMPEMDGKELVEKLTRSVPNLKVLAITGYADKKIDAELRELGFLDVIHKPFEIGKLARTIRRALDEDGYQKPRWGG